MVQWLIYFIPCMLALCAILAARSLIARHAGRSWVVALVIGLALGLWFTFSFEWPSQPEGTYIGFPLPWKYPGKGGIGTYISWDFAVLDMMLFTSVSVYPVWLTNTLWRFLRKRTPAKLRNADAT